VRLCFELHPGFVVYNPATLLRLREACGVNVGANLDPSHLFWQGIDLESAIAELGRQRAIFHVHAKDTAIHSRNAAVNGVLDTTPLDRVAERSWIFRTVGYGHGEMDWRRILTALRLAGYDDVLSIEHEDALMSIDEGFRKGIAFLRGVMPVEPPLTGAWWT
jgi:sugar phosphate isomerase/epimerase